jgi:hypothetical protein
MSLYGFLLSVICAPSVDVLQVFLLVMLGPSCGLLIKLISQCNIVQ